MTEQHIDPIMPRPEDLQSEFLSHEVFVSLGELAKRHTGKRSAFIPVGWHPRLAPGADGYPGQLLDDVVIEPLDLPGIEPFIIEQAEEFQPGFTKIAEQFYEDKALLATVNEKLANGENVAVVTNHGEIYDIAIILCALRVALAKDASDRGEQPLPASQFNLILSRMLTQMGVQSKIDPNQQDATLSILQLVCEVFLSFPNTENVKKIKISKNLIRSCNELMLQKLHHKMDQGGQIIAFAPSGSQDETIVHKFKKQKIIKPVNAGTYKLMKSENTWILAVGVALDGTDGPACSISELSSCKTDDDCDALLNSIADRHTTLTGIRTLYAKTQEDLERIKHEASENVSEVVHEVSTNEAYRRAFYTELGGIVAGAALGYTIGRLLGKRHNQ